MGEVVDGGAAHIHAHARGIERAERPLLACERVVETKIHGNFKSLVTKRREQFARLAGRASKVSIARKDGRSQRDSLANLPANAADMVKAVHVAHNGQARTRRQGVAG